MSRPGRVLSLSGPVKWPAFVLCTCRALGGDPTVAVGAAAAVEFLIASADVVDDLVDDEWEGGRLSWARAQNASHGLTWLAHLCVNELAGTLGPERACLVGTLMSRRALDSCSGEDLDLITEMDDSVTAEYAEKISDRKSGSLVALACQVGGALATDDGEVLSMVGEIGRRAGVAAQLLNDIGGVMAGNDLRRRKKTLPIAYALRCAREEGLQDVLTLHRGVGTSNERDAQRLAEIIRDLGALHYALVVAEAHRQEALRLVRDLIKLTGREEAGEMRRLVPRVWATRGRLA